MIFTIEALLIATVPHLLLAHTHTALIHTLGRGGALNEAFAVLRSMDELEPRLRPNQIIYTSLIQMSVKAGQLQRYESVQESSSNRQYRFVMFQLSFCRYFLNFCIQVNLFRFCLSHSFMNESCVHNPSTRGAHHHRCRCRLLSRPLISAWDTFHAMQQQYEQPDVVLYNVLLQVSYPHQNSDVNHGWHGWHGWHTYYFSIERAEELHFNFVSENR